MKNPPAVNNSWIGGLPVYHLGPGFQNENLILKFEVGNSLSLVDITNVIATIRGTAEPGEVVIS